MTRAALVIAGLAGGCSEYGIDKDPTVGPGVPGGPTTPDDDPAPPGGPTGDTGPADACFAPDFGYQSSPAARLVTTDGTTPITVTMVLSDTAYQNTLVLDAPEALALMDAWTTPVGTVASVGPYPEDTELIFAIDVWNTGDHWQSGPADRNADGVAHVAVTYEGGCAWRIGFEDLAGGGDLDYNDVVFRVAGRLIER